MSQNSDFISCRLARSLGLLKGTSSLENVAKKLFTKKYVVESGMHYMVCSLHFEFGFVEEKLKKKSFFLSLFVHCVVDKV